MEEKTKDTLGRKIPYTIYGMGKEDPRASLELRMKLNRQEGRLLQLYRWEGGTGFRLYPPTFRARVLMPDGQVRKWWWYEYSEKGRWNWDGKKYGVGKPHQKDDFSFSPNLESEF